MAADGIVEAVDVTAVAIAASIRLWKMVRQTSSALRVLKNVSTMALSKQFPLPDIEIEMPFFLSSAWYSMEQYGVTTRLSPRRTLAWTKREQSRRSTYLVRLGSCLGDAPRFLAAFQFRSSPRGTPCLPRSNC